MKKILHLILVVSLFSFVFAQKAPVSAYVFSLGNPQSVPLVNADANSFDNQVIEKTDVLGNQFFLYNNISPKVLKKISPGGTIEWTVTFPVITAPTSRFTPDNLGGFYYVYSSNVVRAGEPTVPNLFVLHYDTDGTYDVAEAQVLDTLFALRPVYATADTTGRLYVIFAEKNIGDSDGKILKYKTAVIGLDGNLQNTPTTRTLNPTEHRWCTNRGTSYEVPYDLPFTGGTLWTACWEWCQSQFLTTPGTCQWNNDGPRNCWVNDFPAGGVNNCTWSDFGSAPPYSGYDGMTLQDEPSINETFLSYNTLDNVYTSISVVQEKPLSDGVLFEYYMTEMDYTTSPSTNTSGYYVQKIGTDGTNQIAGKGLDISAIESASADLRLTDTGLLTAARIDSDSDTYNDTIRVQKYDLTGTPQFAGDGVDVFTFIEENTGIYPTLITRGTGGVLTIEAWNDTTPASGNVEKVFMQAFDGSGNPLLGTGVQVSDYTDPTEPLWVVDQFSDGDGGVFSIVGYTPAGANTQDYHIYWLTSDNQVKYYQDGTLNIAETDNSQPTCSGNSSGEAMCTIVETGAPLTHKIYQLLQDYQITMPAGLIAYAESTPSNIDITVGTDYGTASSAKTVYVWKGSYVVGGPVVDMTADRDWSGIFADVDAPNYKSILHSLSASPGVLANQNAMYVPRNASHTSVRVCPGAVSGFEVITEDCADGVNFQDGQTINVVYQSGNADITATKVTIESVDYWKLLGAKGTGAMSGDFAPTNSAPVVTTGSVSSIASTSATVAGNVSSDGGDAVTERGIVYSLTQAVPTTSDSKQSTSGTTGAMSVGLSGLTTATHYYARAYATNSIGTSYGSVVEFTTLSPAAGPSITTGVASNVDETTATIAGNVSSDGGATITERGVVYSTTSTTPTIANSKQTTTGTTGAMSVNLSGLTRNVVYYARAYATNSQGTSYGAVVSFKTLEPLTLRRVYFTFGKLKYNKYASPATLRTGDTAYIKNYNTSQLKLLQVFLYDYAKKGNQCYQKSKVTTSSMYLRTCSLLPTGKRFAYVMKFQDKATGIIATKYFVVYTTKVWNGQSTL